VSEQINLLRREITAEDVAQAFLAQALALKTTVDVTTVDGGNIAAALRWSRSARPSFETRHTHRPHPEEPAQRASRRMAACSSNRLLCLATRQNAQRQKIAAHQRLFLRARATLHLPLGSDRVGDAIESF